MKDALTEAMDVAGLKSSWNISPPDAFAAWPSKRRFRRNFPRDIEREPYAYLDDAPLEERRRRPPAVEMRRMLPEAVLSEIGRLDPAQSPKCARKPGPTFAMRMNFMTCCWNSWRCQNTQALNVSPQSPSPRGPIISSRSQRQGARSVHGPGSAATGSLPKKQKRSPRFSRTLARFTSRRNRIAATFAGGCSLHVHHGLARALGPVYVSMPRRLFGISA